MSNKEAPTYLKINFFKWRSTGVLFMGIALLIASMHYGRYNCNFFIVGLIISIPLIYISTKHILWKFDINKEKEEEIREKKQARKNQEKSCPQCNGTLDESIRYTCPDCGKLVFKK